MPATWNWRVPGNLPMGTGAISLSTQAACDPASPSVSPSPASFLEPSCPSAPEIGWGASSLHCSPPCYSLSCRFCGKQIFCKYTVNGRVSYDSRRVCFPLILLPPS